MALNDVYDEEFNRYLQFAKNLVSHVKRRSDRTICTKWIQKLVDLPSHDSKVKRLRNEFFRYMLTVLHRAVDESNLDHMGINYDDRNKSHGMGGKDYMCRWSPDQRTYVAVKPMPGQGALVYMAVTKDPKMGWDTEGMTTPT